MKLLRFSDLRARQIVLNRTTLRRWLSLPRDPFPAPIRLGPNTAAWPEDEVLAWIERRRKASTPHAA